MMNDFRGRGRPLLIGSLPLENHDRAADLVFEYTPEIPLWVQLPAHPEESMTTQFLEGLPGLAVEGDRVLVDTSKASFEEELLAFYQEYLAVTEGGVSLDRTRFALSPRTARGFFTFSKRIGSARHSPSAVKGQITGPVTQCTGLTDQDRRAVFYDERLLDVVVKTLALKARWQAEALSKWGVPVIIFLDEPGLAGFGTSAFISITREDVSRILSEVIEAIRQAGGKAGVHVCANTDWSLILESSADILSFDAYGFFDRLVLYRAPLKAFYDRGGTVAWGIVPTSRAEDIDRENVTTLVEKWERQVSEVEGLGVDRGKIRAQSLVTPSCGAGSLSRDHAVKVLGLTREVSKTVRAKWRGAGWRG